MLPLSIASSAFLTTDLQPRFVSPFSDQAEVGAYEAIPGIHQLLRLFRNQIRPVYHVLRTLDGPLPALWYEFAEETVPLFDPEGHFEFVGPYEWIYRVDGLGAFNEAFATHLRRYHVDTLVVAGCCVDATLVPVVQGALDAGFRVVVLADALTGPSADTAANLLRELPAEWVDLEEAVALFE
ncbi:MAG: cysteine hydrolase family protein [Candidatus Margulisiibacteriota bacterium]